MRTKSSANVRVDDLFEVHSGDYHSLAELDSGDTPLISCGDANNGCVGYFDIPANKVYEKCLTVAYNGSWPLLTKFHPYKFGAKDDVAVLTPRKAISETALIYVASLLNGAVWRYSYGRKCFRQKLKDFRIAPPVIRKNGDIRIDETSIIKLFTRTVADFLPTKSAKGITVVPKLKWKTFNIRELLHLQRGDFHSLAALDPGGHMTVSRATDDNGVVGYFERPDDAKIYSRGLITVSTVGADAFVQLDEFIATDNVIVCTPVRKFRLTTLVFIAFALNHQKWRYSYGRQCYREKLAKVNLYLPVDKSGNVDEDAIGEIVTQSSYWNNVEKRFKTTVLPIAKAATAPRFPWGI